jgi:hypothetical protein
MVINIALILLLLGSGKMKLRPYLAAIVLGLIRAVITYLLTHNTETAVISGVMYIVLGFAVVYFFQAVLRSDAAAGPVPANYTAAGTQTVKFKWQYIPLVVSLLLLLLGERVMVYLLRALA